MLLGIVTIGCERIGHNAKQCTNEDLPSDIDEMETEANKVFSWNTCNAQEAAASIGSELFNKMLTRFTERSLC